MRERPRWHFVDLGQMTEAFLDSSILRDDVHPKLDFMMTVMQIYLNLHADHGHTLAPVKFDIQDFDEWDSQDFEERHREWEDDFHELKPKYSPLLLLLPTHCPHCKVTFCCSETRFLSAYGVFCKCKRAIQTTFSDDLYSSFDGTEELFSWWRTTKCAMAFMDKLVLSWSQCSRITTLYCWWWLQK